LTDFHAKAPFVKPARRPYIVAERNGFLHLGAFVTCGKNTLE
jgi:hypothetical protein